MTKFSKALLAIFALGALSQSCGLIPVAEEILRPLVLYVSTSGNDANDCLSEASACLTLQAALDKSNLNSLIIIGAGHFYTSGDPETLEEPTYNLNNGITLSGAGQDLTILHSYKDVYLFGVDGPRPVTIRSLGIDAGSGAEGGINVGLRGNLLLQNSRVFYGNVGVRIQGNGAATINHTVIAKNVDGVVIEGNGVATFYGATIEENSTGVRIRGGSATINNSRIKKNDLGIWNDGILEMSFAQFRNNTGTALRNGGNATVRGGTVHITDSTFYDNGLVDRTSLNPIIENSGDMSISTSTISYNYGTAVSNEIPRWAGYAEDRKLVLDHVKILGNQSSGRLPCAIANDEGTLQVRNSNIQGNECVGVDVYGGHVEIYQSSIIDNNIGIFARGESRVQVDNTTISGNNGFGIEQVEDAILELYFVTVAFNRGVGISSSDPVTFLEMWNTVVALNYMGECNAAIVGYGDFVCNESWTRSTLGLGPLTEEAGTLVHPLLPGSPLIDAADAYCRGISDQRGSARLVGFDCDIGAYERGSTVAAVVIETPSGGVPGVVPLYTDTPTPATPIILTFTKNAYCRKGPSALYRDVSGFKQGDSAQADGRNEDDPRWWWVQIPNSQGHCWVSHTTVETNDLAEGLPVQTVSLELPEAPSDFVVSKRACTGKSYSLRLAWTKSPDADGYILYRNGEEIATFKANQTTYEDSPAMNQYHLYELAAFNADGYSERLGVEDNCP